MMLNQLRHTNWKMVQNRQYQIYAFYFFICCTKTTDRIGGKALNMHHQSQMIFWVILIGNPQQQKGYLIYVPSTRKIVFHKTFYLKKI